MSWDRTKYEATCSQCGKKGFVVQAQDDWGRSSTKWFGFDNIQPSPTDVGRKRVSSEDFTPLCACGSNKISIGKMLGSCDYKGELSGGS